MIENPEYQYSEVTNDVKVEVRPFHVPEKSDPENKVFFFAYAVKITNVGSRNLKLVNRHWSIRDGRKNERYVNGNGVVGQTPLLEPGESFSYTSFCPLNTPTGNMRGKYQFKDEDGESFWAHIPLFFLRTNETYH